MATIIIVPNRGELQREIRKRIERDTTSLRLLALDVCVRAEADAVRLTNADGLVDLGFYRLSWGHRGTSTGAEVGNSAPYAPVLEWGRRPGRPGPPLAPIYEWVQRHFRKEVSRDYTAARAIGIGLAKGRGPDVVRRVKQDFGSKEGAVNARLLGIAMAIRDKIHARGTKPHYVLKRVHATMKKRFRSSARRMLRRAS